MQWNSQGGPRSEFHARPSFYKSGAVGWELEGPKNAAEPKQPKIKSKYSC